MATRVCRHCGAMYRGLACPCRREAARRRRELRQQEAQEAEVVRCEPEGDAGAAEMGEGELRAAARGFER